ncbi:hypothetical protein RSW49_23305, partial [Escherichia coli]|nr:hypothetical protein [Escherichia coli]
RHIVAVGINKVVYIEPYEKSLALELHDDAITEVNESGKVLFESFEGVSPRRYHKFFFSTDERKDSKGNAEKYSTKYKNHIDIQFIDSYVDFENRVADIFISNTKTDAEAQVAVPSGTPVNPLLPPIPPTPPTSV